MSKKDSLGDRMKGYYEDRYRISLTRRVPVILRLDGKAFHTFTRGCDKPFDSKIVTSMASTANHLLNNIQGAKVAYVQSDEITLLLTDYDKLETDAWFDYNLQKMVSIAASMASVFFTLHYNTYKMSDIHKLKTALFDCRAFNLPKEEVVNNFRWRYQDWLRNSIQMLAQSLFSHKELQGKKSPELHEMCFQKGHNWNDLSSQYKNGTLYVKKEGQVIQLTNFNLNNNEQCDIIFKDFI